MTDPGLIQSLDYILNQTDESTIEVISEAVDRRRKNLTIFSAVGNIPNPQRMAKELTEKINEGIGGGIEAMRNSIREMIIRIIKEHAPELNLIQIDELVQAWLPDGGVAVSEDKRNLPPDVLLSMVEQFVTFSHGNMKKSVDEELRKEMGAWPERYWKSFPPVVRALISDYLKNNITEKDFKTRLSIAIGV